jgi:hypothetical protein
MRGLDPRIHRLKSQRFHEKMDGRVLSAKTRFALLPGHEPD